VTSEIVRWSVIHLSLVGRFNFNHATIAEVKMVTSSQSTPPRTSSKKPVAEPATKLISPSTTLAAVPSFWPPPTVLSTLT